MLGTPGDLFIYSFITRMRLVLVIVSWGEYGSE